MNIICLAGNVSRDAEVKYLSNGDAVASFSVADNMGKDKGAIFWNCSLFGKRGDSLSPYLKKGTAVTVTGQVTEREWTDKEGIKRKSMDVRVNDVALQGGKREESAAPRPEARPAQRQAASVDDDSFDVPF